MAVHLKRVNLIIWRATSDDPQELARANEILRGEKPNPEIFHKDKDGRFFFEAVIAQFDHRFPWDEVTFGR